MKHEFHAGRACASIVLGCSALVFATVAGAMDAQGEAASTMTELTALQMRWKIDGCSRTQPQEVTCRITVTNQSGDKRLNFALREVVMVDDNGTEYQAKGGGFGQNESRNPMMANGVGTHGTFRFEGVDPKATHAARFGFADNQQPIMWSNVAFNGSGSSSVAGKARDKLKDALGLGSSTPASGVASGTTTDTTTASSGTEKKSKWKSIRDKLKGAAGG